MNISVYGIDGVIQAMEETVEEYPKKVRSFLKAEGNTVKKRVKDEFNTKGLHRLTGNYLNGISVQRPYNYYKENGGKAPDSVKTYGKRSKRKEKSTKYGTYNGSKGGGANHTHLIEEGHEKVLWGRRTAERVRAFYVYSDAKRKYEGEFEANAEAFVNEMLSKF